jgi:hypothetical protein
VDLEWRIVDFLSPKINAQMVEPSSKEEIKAPETEAAKNITFDLGENISSDE